MQIPGLSAKEGIVFVVVRDVVVVFAGFVAVVGVAVVGVLVKVFVVIRGVVTEDESVTCELVGVGDSKVEFLGSVTATVVSFV